MRTPWKTGVLLGSAIGLIVATTIMYVAWEHNAQGEIHNEAGISWGHWLLIGTGWFVLVAAPLSLVFGSLLALVSNLRSRGAG